MTVQIQLRRDTEENWKTNSSVILADGEIGLVLTTKNGVSSYTKMKIGDGQTPWVSLPYFDTVISYKDLTDLPSINNEVLKDNLSLEDLQIQIKGDYAFRDAVDNELGLKANFSDVYTREDVDNKVIELENSDKKLEDLLNEKISLKYFDEKISDIEDSIEYIGDTISGLDNLVEQSVTDALSGIDIDGLVNIGDTLNLIQSDVISNTNDINKLEDSFNNQVEDINSIKENIQDEVKDLDNKINNTTPLSTFQSHLGEKNPHSITKEIIGLSNVNDTSDEDKPISKATQDALDNKQRSLTAGTGINIESDDENKKDIISVTFHNADWNAEFDADNPDFTAIFNKPKINNNELNSESTSESLGLASKQDMDDVKELTNSIKNNFDEIKQIVADLSEKDSELEVRIETYENGRETELSRRVDIIQTRILPDFRETDEDFEKRIRQLEESTNGVLTDITNKADKSELENYIQQDDLENYVTQDDLERAILGDIDLANYYTKEYVDDEIDDGILEAIKASKEFTAEVLKSYATNESLKSYATINYVDGALMTKANVSDVYTKDDVYTKEELPSIIMNKLTEQTVITSISETSGTISLEPNKIYSMTINGKTTFTLPTVTDMSKFHQIKLMIKVDATTTINWGTTYFFNKETPDIDSGNSYDVYYDYDNLLRKWVCGVIVKGVK